MKKITLKNLRAIDFKYTPEAQKEYSEDDQEYEDEYENEYEDEGEYEDDEDEYENEYEADDELDELERLLDENDYIEQRHKRDGRRRERKEKKKSKKSLKNLFSSDKSDKMFAAIIIAIVAVAIFFIIITVSKVKDSKKNDEGFIKKMDTSYIVTMLTDYQSALQDADITRIRTFIYNQKNVADEEINKNLYAAEGYSLRMQFRASEWQKRFFLF